MIEELTKLKDALDKVLIPQYPALGSMGGGSQAEAKLEDEWEREYGKRKEEYELHTQIREALDDCFEEARRIRDLRFENPE